MPFVPLVLSKNCQTLGSVFSAGRSWGSGYFVSAHRRPAKAWQTSSTAAFFWARVGRVVSERLIRVLGGDHAGFGFCGPYVAAVAAASAVPLPEPPGLLLEFQKRMSSSARQPL